MIKSPVTDGYPLVNVYITGKSPWLQYKVGPPVDENAKLGAT